MAFCSFCCRPCLSSTLSCVPPVVEDGVCPIQNVLGRPFDLVLRRSIYFCSEHAVLLFIARGDRDNSLETSVLRSRQGLPEGMERMPTHLDLAADLAPRITR